MMKMNKPARKHRSKLIANWLENTSLAEKMQVRTKMLLAVRIEDWMISSGWSKGAFAEKLNKHPSEITKWLSGTHNFTVDTLSEIAAAFQIGIEGLFISHPSTVVDQKCALGTEPALYAAIKDPVNDTAIVAEPSGGEDHLEK